MSADPREAESGGFGGFLLGGMPLALPMTALREVVACTTLVAVPCAARCVIGSIDLRGTLVPVIDLQRTSAESGAVSTSAPMSPFPTVIIMAQGGYIVGLLADGVTGIFQSEAGSFRRVAPHDGEIAIFHGGVKRADDGSLVNVLCPVAISRLADVPMVEDPEPQRGDAATSVSDAASGVIDEDTVPMMLFRAGGVPLAIEALTVQATLSSPEVQPSPLAMGVCRGVIAYGGAMIPALDLQALCWLGTGADVAATSSKPSQAFVLSLDAGRVAFLVDSVIDVVHTRTSDRMGVPRFAMPHPRLFSGALAAAALPAELIERPGASASQYFVIDAAALRTCDEVRGLSSTNVPDDGDAVPNSPRYASNQPTGGAAKTGRTVVTFMLHHEQATPIDQLSEILPFHPEMAGIGARSRAGALLGYMVDRGRSIPVLDLMALTGLAPVPMTAQASVLVVESDGEWLGFAVNALRTIEAAAWEVGVPRASAADSQFTGGYEIPRQLALVGSHDGERLLPLLHLRDLATDIRLQAKVPRPAALAAYRR